MDPLISSLVNLGGGFVLAAAILMLHREAIKAFREEMSMERQRSDANFQAFLGKLDALRDAWLDAKCKVPDGALCVQQRRPLELP